MSSSWKARNKARIIRKALLLYLKPQQELVNGQVWKMFFAQSKENLIKNMIVTLSSHKYGYIDYSKWNQLGAILWHFKTPTHKMKPKIKFVA